MNQISYRKWIMNSFVPTVHELNCNQRVTVTSSSVRNGLIDNKDHPAVIKMMQQYETVLGAHWKFTSYTDRVRYALLTACNLGLATHYYGRMINVVGCGGRHYRRRSEIQFVI